MSFLANAKQLFTGSGRLSTKSIAGAIVGFGTLMQVPQFGQPILKFGAHHPHVASIVGALVGLAALLHNPQVQKVLHIERIEVTTGSSTTLAMPTYLNVKNEPPTKET